MLQNLSSAAVVIGALRVNGVSSGYDGFQPKNNGIFKVICLSYSEFCWNYDYLFE